MHFCRHGVGDAGSPQGCAKSIRDKVWPCTYWWISSGFIAPSTRMGPPLTESPGQCRVGERGRAGSLKRQTQPRAACNACSKDGGNRGTASGADRLLENRGAFQGTPSEKCWKSHKGCTKKKPRGHHLRGRWLFRFRVRGLGAGNDCDALRSSMEQGQDGPRESVVDADPEEESSRRAGNGADFTGIWGGD